MPNRPRPPTPMRLILRLTRPNVPHVALGALMYIGAAVTSMTQLWLLGKIIDDGLIAGSAAAFLALLGVMAALVVVQPVLWVSGWRLFFRAEARGQVAVIRSLTDHLNTVGTGVQGTTSSGEMVNLATDDARNAAKTISETGFILNNLAMFITGSALVWTIHPVLGMVIVAGSLVTAVITGPLLGRLQRRQTEYRTMLGALTAQAADIVGGLRVLRGIGGDLRFAERYRGRSEELRRTGYRVAESSSWIYALRHSMPIVFVAAITWTGAILAANGAISFGGLAAAFSFATVFIAISGNFIGSAHYLVASWVGAKRVVRFLAVEPAVDGGGEHRGATGELHDPDSDLTVPQGRLTVLVTAETAPALAVCERLARHRDSDAQWGTQPLSAVDLAEVRRRVVLLTDTDYLFAQTLGETLHVDRDAAMAAIETACAGDVYTSLGSSLDAEVADGGRNLSGGQRQRLRLARALAARPEILLAVEPTSAVDAHTESFIAERVAAARNGLTTLVVTTSPLWIALADRVVWMVDGKVRAAGTSAQLAADPEYRRLASHRETA